MIINKLTGEEPTKAEMDAIKCRAIEIFSSPYASPEQMEWAIEMYPEGFAEMFGRNAKNVMRYTEAQS